tara:strand:- start:82 stop:480 length:399 start_codon:yes stop_codon:yes gene_type:complete
MASRTSNPVRRKRITQKALTADTTLTAADSGTTFLLDAIGEEILLPVPTADTTFRFRCAVTTATTNWTIVAPSAVIYGSATVAGALIAASAETTITLVVAKFLPGDLIELESDGTNYYVDGDVVTALGVTFV